MPVNFYRFFNNMEQRATYRHMSKHASTGPAPPSIAKKRTRPPTTTQTSSPSSSPASSIGLKEGGLLLCSNFPCFTNVASPDTPDYRISTETRLIVVVAQTFASNLLVVPITSAPGQWRIPIHVASSHLQSIPSTLFLSGDQQALLKGTRGGVHIISQQIMITIKRVL
jgi:hypothetical protein